MAKFKEQPKQDCWCCKNVRHSGLDKEFTVQERRFFCNSEVDY